MGSNRLGPKGRALAAATSLVVLSAAVAPPSVAAPPDRGDTTPADPVVSPEHPVADAVIGTRRGDQSRVASASDGDAFLVVWREDGRILGSRVSAAGEVLDLAGIVIAEGEVTDPAVSWDGANYLVVWSHFDRTRWSRAILGARVTPEGTVLDPAPIPIAAGPWATSPAVAFNGTHHLVVWAGRGSHYDQDVVGARIDPGGNVVDEETIPVATGPHGESSPAVASDGRDFLVAWNDDRSGSTDIFATRVSGGGDVLDDGGFAVTTAPLHQWLGAVAWDGSVYLLVWTDRRDGEHTDVVGARVNAAGAVEGPELTIAGGPENDWRPSVVRSAAGAYVVWHDAPTEHPEYGAPPPWSVFGQRVADGAVVGSPVRIGTGKYPAAAFNGSEHLVSWSVGQEVLPGPYPPQDDVYAARVSAGSSLLDDPALHLTPQANTQLEPSVAWNGRTYLVAWKDGRGAPSNFFARLSPTGDSLDGAGIPYSGPRLHKVVAASNGDGFLLVWTIGGGIAGVRIDADGTVLDPEPFTVSPGPGAVSVSDPVVASDGDDYFVVWRYSNREQHYRPEVVGARIPAAGTPGPIVPISSAEGSRPALAWNGEHYFVAWLQESSDAKGPPARRGPGITGVRLDRAGTVLDRRGVFVPADDGRTLSPPTVAAANGDFLVVWNSEAIDYRGPTSTEAVRVNASGRVLDRSPLVLAPAHDHDLIPPLVTWNGVHYLLVRNRGLDVVASRVNEAGSVLDPDGFAVAGSPDRETEPAVTAGPHGRSAVAYVRLAPEPPYYGAHRVFMRFVDDP